MVRPSIEITRRKKRYGRCRICLKFKELTKEHVPPERAFNDQAYYLHYVDEMDKADRIQWESREENTNGIYLFTLCSKCNNQTGYRYGRDYVGFVRTVEPFVRPENANQTVGVAMADFFPLRVVKQAISMILSTSQPTSFDQHKIVGAPGTQRSSLSGIEINLPDKPALSRIYDELRLFVRYRDRTELPNSVKLYVFAGIGPIGFRTGVFFWADIVKKSGVCAAVTGFTPIHWVLVFDGDLSDQLLDVTEWSNYAFKDRCTKTVQMPCYWFVGKYPLDFRSPEELYESNFRNSMKFEGFIPTYGITKQEATTEAVFFARTLGKVTKEGYLISQFTSGVYYEAKEINGWLPSATVEDTMELIKWRLESESDGSQF